jgi:catechol 2,3-dioxygenase-like lactoylglutathione lyase family enzyme
MTRFAKVIPRLPVVDLKRAIGFYTSILGFKLDLIWPESAPSFAILHRDSASVQFYTATEPPAEPVGHATIYFDVDDTHALHAILHGCVPVEWGPEVYWYGRREFAIRDPSGYLLIFSETTDDPPTCQEAD